MQVQPALRGDLPSTADLLAIIAFEEDIRDDFPSGHPPLALVSDLLRAAIMEQRFKGKSGQSITVDTQGRVPSRRVMVLGGGKRSAVLPAEYHNAAALACKAANSLGVKSLLVLEEAGVPNDKKLARLEAITQGAVLGSYRFEKYLSADKRLPLSLEQVTVEVSTPINLEDAAPAVERARRLADAVSYARDLVNEPAGALTPAALADGINIRAQAAGLDVVVLGPEECRARGMGMFLAVAQGSQQPPRFVHLSWRPPAAKRRIVIVGKGVTFDSGGLSLKTNEGMMDMKSDMAGAAAVLSAILVAAEEKLPVEVHALAACTENMPSGSAYKLGDVLRSMSGKTVEINNTDAEGRLTLGDALTYGLELKPDVILDFATLTGACVVALGPHTAGVMTNNEAARSEWLEATRTAGEDMWPLPLPSRLTEQLKSEIADLRNTGERWGGALTAGLFLKEFVGEYPWIHVDIAGPATASKEWGATAKGATGFAVASIVTYLRAMGR